MYYLYINVFNTKHVCCKARSEQKNIIWIPEKLRIFEKRGTMFFWFRALSLLPIAENLEESRFCHKGMFYYTALLEERVENIEA